ncbi:hypothetical protein D3C80_1621220 [compost metagenome]
MNRADANSTRNKRIQDVIKKATEQTEAAVASAGDVSDREVVKSIRKNRAEERQHNRLSEAFKLGGKTGLSSGKVLGFSQPNKPDYSTPNIAELLSGFEEDGDE